MVPHRFGRSVRWTALALAGGGIAGVAWFLTLGSRAYVNPLPDLSSTSAVKPLLDERERKMLWEIEHHGNVLGKFGFKPLAAALEQNDAARVRRLLAREFKGELPRQVNDLRLSRAEVEVYRQESTGPDREALPPDQFLERLLEFRRRFVLTPEVRFSLMTFSPVSRADLSGEWTGICQLRMWGLGSFTGESPAALLYALAHTGLAPVGWAGLSALAQPAELVMYLEFHIAQPTQKGLEEGGWLHSAAVTQVQYGRASSYLLREVTAERGINPLRFHDNWTDPEDRKLPSVGGVYLCDYNRDGILDVLMTDIVAGHVFYQGEAGGRFRVATSQVGLPSKAPAYTTSHEAAFADLDGDGWEDLILDQRFYRNEEGRRFVDVTDRTNSLFPDQSTGISLADFDGDGFVDIYFSRGGVPKSGDWLNGKSGDWRGNQLWRNAGNWKFENVTLKSGAGGGQRSVFTSVWLDADNDGWPDLYVINEFGDGVLLLNRKDGTFREHMIVDRRTDFGSMGVTTGDIDNDGNIDIYVANMYSKAGTRVIGNLRPGLYPDEVMHKLRRLVSGSQLHLNRGGLKFEQRGEQFRVAAVGWAYGPALVDLDNDGWLDIYATAGFISQNRDEPDT